MDLWATVCFMVLLALLLIGRRDKTSPINTYDDLTIATNYSRTGGMAEAYL